MDHNRYLNLNWSCLEGMCSLNHALLNQNKLLEHTLPLHSTSDNLAFRLQTTARLQSSQLDTLKAAWWPETQKSHAVSNTVLRVLYGVGAVIISYRSCIESVDTTVLVLKLLNLTPTHHVTTTSLRSS